MERLFPSEVARLILGFLQDINCTKTWETFMTECPYLQEYYQLYKDGEIYSTNVGGKSLREILHEYSELKAEARNRSVSQRQPSQTSTSLSDLQNFKTPQKNTASGISNFRSEPARRGLISSPKLFRNPVTPHNPRSRQSEPGCSNVNRNKSTHPHQSPRMISSDDESVVVLDSYLHGRSEQDVDESSSVCSASVTLVASDNLSHSNVNSPLSSVYEAVEGPSTNHHAPVLNSSVVLQSTEVTACRDSIVFASSSLSLTPRHSTDHRSHHRAPATNSPRTLLLSYDQSQVPSLTTPLKNRRGAEEFTSPKRKGFIPRRRLMESPVTKSAIPPLEYPLNALHDDLDSILEEFFKQQPLAQRIADNINKIMEDQTKIPGASNSSCCVTLQDACETGGSANNNLLLADGNPTPGPHVMDSSRYRDDTSSTREPATHPTKNSRISNEPITSMIESSLAASKSDLNTKETATRHSSETRLERIPESSEDATPEVCSATQSSREEAVTTTQGSNGPEDTPMDVVDSEPGAVVLNDTPNPESNSVSEDSETVAGQTNKSKIKEVTIGTPFNIETQMVVAAESTPILNKETATLTVDSSFNAGISTASTPVNLGVANNAGVAANLITLPNGNLSIIPTMQNPLYQSVPSTAFVQFSYPNLQLVPTTPAQNTIQYRIVVPGPNCKELSNAVTIEPVQTISSAAVNQSMPVVNPSPFKIPADYSPMKSLLSGSILQNNNVASFVTVPSNDNGQMKKANAFDVSESPVPQNVSASEISEPNVVTDPKSVQSKASTSHTKKKVQGPSKPKEKSIRRRQKKTHKLKPKFPPPAENAVPSLKDSQPEENNFPVLSIPEPSPRSESLSALDHFEQITGVRESAQSPILNSLISSAMQCKADGGRFTTSCVRTLDFDNHVEINSPSCVMISRQSPHSESRKSPRLKDKKESETPSSQTKEGPKANDGSSKEQEAKKSKNRTRSSKSTPNETVTSPQTSCIPPNSVITTIEDVINDANKNYVELTEQDETVSQTQADPPSKKKKTQSLKKASTESKTVSDSPAKKKTATPKKPKKLADESKILSREEYFPDSDTDFDSSNENMPLSSILAAKKAASSNTKIDNSGIQQNEELPIAQGSNLNQSVEVIDLKSTNEKTKEGDDDYVPPKSDLQYISAETETRTTRSSNKSGVKKVSQASRRTAIPTLPSKSMKKSGKLQAMFMSMLSSIESNDDSSEEINVPNMQDRPLSPEIIINNAKELPSNLEKTIVDNNPLAESPPNKLFSPVKNVVQSKSTEDNRIKNPNASDTARSILKMCDYRKNKANALKQGKKLSTQSNSSDTPLVSKKTEKAGNVRLSNFVPPVSALQKGLKNSNPPLNLNKFTNDEVLNKLLKPSANISCSKQSSLEESAVEEKETIPTSSSTNRINVSCEAETTVKIPNTSRSNENVSMQGFEGCLTGGYSYSQSLQETITALPHPAPNTCPSTNSKIASSSRSKVLPPPKKRIRPVTATGNFSPFLTLTSPEQTTVLDLSSVSQNAVSPSLNNESTEPVSEKKTTSFFNCKTVSGKPRAMVEFYQQVRPEKKDGIPISPGTISSSSCTLDTFIARTQAKTAVVSENEPLNLVSPAKRIDQVNMGVKRKLSSASLDISLENLVRTPEKVVSNDSLSFGKSSEEGIPTSLEESVTKKSLTSPVKKRLKLSENASDVESFETSRKIIDDDSYEEGMIISPCKDSIGKKPESTASCLTQNTKDLHNPVDFSQSRIVNQPSPVRRELSVGREPQPGLKRKKYELNPEFPSGVKFPRVWKNSDLSHYSRSIEKNIPSHDNMRKGSVHSKTAKKRKQSQEANYYTPEKKHHRKPHSQSSHRTSGQSRLSDSSLRASQSKYVYSRYYGSRHRSPYNHSYDSNKSSGSKVQTYRRNFSTKTSEDRMSPSRTPSPSKADHRGAKDASKSSKINKHSKDSDKRTTEKVSHSINKEKKDSVDLLPKHGEHDRNIDDERCVKPLDSKVECRHTSKLSSPLPPGQTKTLNLSKNKDFSAGDKEFTNSIKDSRKESTLSDCNELVLSSAAKKSNKIHKKNSNDLQETFLNKDTPNRLQKELPDKLKSSAKNVRGIELGEENMSDLADTSHKSNLTNTSKVTPTRGADTIDNLSAVKNMTLEKEKSDISKNKDSMLSELKLKKVSEISKGKSTSISNTKIKTKRSPPVKISKLPIEQVSPSTNPHLTERKSSPCSNPPGLEKNTKSDQVHMKSPHSNLIHSCKTSTSKSTKCSTSELMQSKEKHDEKNLFATEIAHELPNLNANKQNDVSDHQKLDPNPSSINKPNKLETLFKKAKALELKKAAEQSSNTNERSSSVADDTTGDNCNTLKMNKEIENVSPTSSLSTLNEKKASELKKTKEQCSSVNTKASAMVNEDNDNTPNTNKQIETVCATSSSTLEKNTNSDNAHVGSPLSNSSDAVKTSCNKSTKSGTSELMQTKENMSEKKVNIPITSLHNKHPRKHVPSSSIKKSKEPKLKKVKAKKKLVNDTAKHPSKRKQKDTSSAPELNPSEASEKSKPALSEADLQLNLSRTSADQHEIEEAVASIYSGAGLQGETPKKNQEGSNSKESSASGPSSSKAPETEQENVHSNLLSDLACSSESNEKEKNTEAEKMQALVSKINEYGWDKLAEMVRRKDLLNKQDESKPL